MENSVNPYITDTNQPLNDANRHQQNDQYVPVPSNQGNYQPPPNYLQGNYPVPPPVHQIYNQNPQLLRPTAIIIKSNAPPAINPRFVPNNQIYIPANMLICRVCRRETNNYVRHVAGNVTWSWCCCLFFFTGILCWIPCCINSCKDQQLACVVCQSTKARQPANCC